MGWSLWCQGSVPGSRGADHCGPGLPVSWLGAGMVSALEFTVTRSCRGHAFTLGQHLLLLRAVWPRAGHL